MTSITTISCPHKVTIVRKHTHSHKRLNELTFREPTLIDPISVFGWNLICFCFCLFLLQFLMWSVSLYHQNMIVNEITHTEEDKFMLGDEWLFGFLCSLSCFSIDIKNVVENT